jgi:signal transduction histidine kinase
LRTQALADANDELANLQKEKDSFLAVLTHDMRTPLTSIQGYATILGSQRVEDDQQMQMGRIILRNGETLLDIVNNMLEIEQMKAGMPVTLERSQFDLARLAERTVEAIQSQAMEKDINLQCHVTEPPVLIDGDEKKIERVLLNLTSNAIKYTQREGCVGIAVQMNGRYAILEVSDNGYGIPADEVDHIFDSYRRVKDHQHIALGTGLGLAIVKSLVEAHEGKIDVVSEVDKGSTFTVKLPLPEITDP